MRAAPLVAVTFLLLAVPACGGGAPTAKNTPVGGTSVSSATRATSSSTHRVSTVARSAPTHTPAAAATAPPSASAAPPPPQTPPPSSTGSAAPAAVAGPCSPADVGISTSTDMSHYAPGENVQASVVVRNLSAHSCIFDRSGEFTVDADSPPPSSQPTVFMVHLECPSTGCSALAPGQMSTYPIGWNQLDNQAQKQVPPGGYHAKATFPGLPTASAPFTIG